MQDRRTKVRQPAVAGLFYPAEPERLRQDVDAMLHCAEPHPGPVPKAIIVPHAGYIYSGPIAATAYRQLLGAGSEIRRVVLIGPAHRVYLEGMAVPSADAFATPLGNVPLDRDLIREISRLPGVCVSDAAHRDEHSLEVQLPFLQSVLYSFALVPIVAGHCEASVVASLLDNVWSGPETLIVISSDLSHYLPYDQAKQIDRKTCERILSGATTLQGDEACGAAAINGLMFANRHHQLRIDSVDLRNSGDTCGDKNRVVGYGAFTLH